MTFDFRAYGARSPSSEFPDRARYSFAAAYGRAWSVSPQTREAFANRRGHPGV